MNKKSSIVLLLLVIILSYSAFSQQIKFNKLTTADREHFGSVQGITQDVKGAMWFSTARGLYKYDGSQMMAYYNDPSNPNSLMSNNLKSVFADVNGDIWIGSYGYGMDRFNPKTEKFTHFQNDPKNQKSLSNDNVTCILRDKSGDLWIGTHQGLNRYNEKTNSFTHFRHDQFDSSSISNNHIEVIYEDKNGNLWIGTGNPFPNGGGGPESGGLNRMDKTNGTFTRYLHNINSTQSLSNNKITAIFEDNKGDFWIGTGQKGLHKMDREHATFERLEYDLSPPKKSSGRSGAVLNKKETPLYDHITFITQDIAGNYWFGTMNTGIYSLDPHVSKIKRSSKTNNSDSKFDEYGALSAYNSRDGILWFGQARRAYIYHVDPLKTAFPFYPTSERVNGIHEEANGNLWLGGNTVSILSNHKEIQNLKINKNNPSSDRDNRGIRFVNDDSQGNIWIGSHDGLNLWDKENNAFIQYKHDPLNDKSLSDSRVLSFCEDEHKNLWIGTVNGLNKMNPKTGVFSRYYFKLGDTINIGDNVITAVIEDHNGKIWVGHGNSNGIYLFDKETKENKNYLKGASIICMYEDLKGILWVGSRKGLFRYNKDKDNFTQYTDPGLLGGFTYVASITEDDQNFLWIVAEIGLRRINLARNESSEIIERTDFYWYSSYKDLNGNLYFGSTKGYYHVNPKELPLLQKPPEINLSGFLLSDQLVSPSEDGPLKEDISLTKEIRLQYDQNTFSIDYEIVDYADPAENRLIYFLENYEQNWHPANSERRAYYFNISPGKYTFHLKGSNAYGAWAEKKITIIIMPPWYKTWWAYIMYLFLLLVAIFGLYSFQRRRLQLAENEKNRKREIKHAKEIEKAYSELKSTQAQLIQSEKMASLGELTAGIAHEIQNPLNFVNNFSEVSEEILAEMDEEIEKGNLEEIKTISTDLKQNLSKISHHGKRADSIVKGMLMHSRTSKGEKIPTDINALCDEFLRLSYHGLRAKDRNFNADFETHFDETIPKIEVIPQDIGRVMLNLINNAFQSVGQKFNNENENNNYKPRVIVETKLSPSGGGQGVEYDQICISVSDNGPGIPEDIKDKIFQPFFTTKPTGQGTGLGLSLAYDIVKAHNGSLKVESNLGKGSKFFITIPIK